MIYSLRYPPSGSQPVPGHDGRTAPGVQCIYKIKANQPPQANIESSEVFGTSRMKTAYQWGKLFSSAG